MAFADGEMHLIITANSGDVLKRTDGSYVAIWASGAAIFGQAFDVHGAHIGGQFTVRTIPNTVNPFADISATLLSNGHTIVAWTEGSSIKALRLGADYQAIGTVQDLGSDQVLNERAPEIYDIGNGNYTVLYKGDRQNDNVGIVAQTTVVGTIMTKEPVVTGQDPNEALTVLTNGTFLIFYNNRDFIRLEDHTNPQPAGKTVPRTDPDAPINQAATALADGKFVLAWCDNATVGGTPVIKAQVFDSNRDAVGTAVTFAAPAGAVESMNVTQLSNGGFALLLTVNNGADKDVYVASCSANVTIIIQPSLVGAEAAGDQFDPEVIALANGAFAVSWLDTLNNSAKFITEVFGAPPEDPDPEDTNEAPSDIQLITGGSAASVDEHKTGGTVVATVTADDDGGAAGLRYSLTDNTFEIDPVTGQIRVKAGAVLDYERAGSHTLSVTVTDKNGTGLSATQTITIKVRDLLESQLGTSAKNALVGGIGADKINGGSGNDVLTGGLGADVFVFDTALGRGTTAKNHNKKVNFDTITDFKPGEDKIWLDNKIFTKLGRAGSEASPAALNKKFFKTSKATDKDDYLVYKSGVVYYDQDGKGAKYKPVEIIKIANKVALSATDFFVV